MVRIRSVESPVSGARLISSYLAGEDKLTKNVPATAESTIKLAMAMFLLLDEFWATSEPKSLGASQHPDKGVCQFGWLILAMSQSSDALLLLDHITDYLRFNSNTKFSGFHSIRATTMAATLPVDSIWTRKTTRLCPLSSCRPCVTSLCQLIVASPLVVLSLCLPLIILSRELVVTLPLAILSLCHPLVLSLRQLVVVSLLLALLLRVQLVLLSRRWLLYCLLTGRTLVVSSSRRLVVSSSRRLVVSSSRRLVVSSSRRLVVSSSCHLVVSPSHRSSYRHTSWLSHHLSLSSCCATLLSSHPAGWLLRCLSLNPLSSSRRAGHPLSCHCLVIVHRQLHQTP